MEAAATTLREHVQEAADEEAVSSCCLLQCSESDASGPFAAQPAGLESMMIDEANGSAAPMAVPSSLLDQVDTDAAPLSPEQILMLPFHVETRDSRDSQRLKSACAAHPFAVDETGRPAASLPTSRAGIPKGAAPWVAAVLYWISSQPELQPLTGLSVKPAEAADKSSIGQTCPAVFIRKPMIETDPNGYVIASMVRQLLKDCGSGLKLIGWDAVRKHLSGDASKGAAKWWINPRRGGNDRGDHSQSYYEAVPFLFQAHAEKLEECKPGQLQRSIDNWHQTRAENAAPIVDAEDGRA